MKVLDVNLHVQVRLTDTHGARIANGGELTHAVRLLIRRMVLASLWELQTPAPSSVDRRSGRA
jgi:hypothetical protein